MKRLFLFIVLFLLSVPFMAGDLSEVVFTWPTNATLGLPWYPVSPTDVEICTRDLTSSLGQNEQNEIVDLSLDTPIYMDTITLIAVKKKYGELDYYEVGWYVQPFEGSYNSKVVLYGTAGNVTLASGSPSKQSSFAGYKAFTDPCDPDVYQCPNIGTPTRVRLEWGDQYLVSAFVEVNQSG